jgi:hypothetical protein
MDFGDANGIAPPRKFSLNLNEQVAQNTVTFKTIGASPILGVAATFPQFLTIL